MIAFPFYFGALTIKMWHSFPQGRARVWWQHEEATLRFIINKIYDVDLKEYATSSEKLGNGNDRINPPSQKQHTANNNKYRTLVKHLWVCDRWVVHTAVICFCHICWNACDVWLVIRLSATWAVTATPLTEHSLFMIPRPVIHLLPSLTGSFHWKEQAEKICQNKPVFPAGSSLYESDLRWIYLTWQ